MGTPPVQLVRLAVQLIPALITGYPCLKESGSEPVAVRAKTPPGERVPEALTEILEVP